MTIVLSHVTKAFGSKKALDDATLSFAGGQIHALLGENGAGKSTLARILCGAIEPDSGTITDGASSSVLPLKNEGDAAKAGIMQVHQTPLLASSLTVMQNILLGMESSDDHSKKSFFLFAGISEKKQYEAEAKNLVSAWCPELDTSALVRDTGGDGRFYTALISCLCRKPKVLVLDEPGALLDWRQRRLLYANIRNLANSGTNIIVITHSMSEAELYTDTVTVLVHGKIAADYTHSRDFDRNRFAFSESLSGNAKEHVTAVHSSFLMPSLSFEHIFCRPQMRPAVLDCTFSATGGSVTLINGLTEDGLGTLENIVTGMEDSQTNGTCKISMPQKNSVKKISLDIRKKKLTAAILRRPFRNDKKSGLADVATGIIPSDRTMRGSNPSLTVCELLAAQYTGKNPRSYAQKLISLTDVSITLEDCASSLSGGMMQKLIFTRELSCSPSFAVLCEPLQGLDSVSAQHTVSRIRMLAESGSAVLVLSASGFPETAADKVYSLESGALTEKVKQTSASERDI